MRRKANVSEVRVNNEILILKKANLLFNKSTNKVCVLLPIHHRFRGRGKDLQFHYSVTCLLSASN